MANQVCEVMNSDVLSFEANAPARTALDLMLTTGVTAAPIVDGRDHPIGVISIRQLARAPVGARLASFLHAPALITSPSASLDHAARLLDEADLHHLVVVDEHGRLSGFVSSLDLLRGIIGTPARHPDTFVHWDPGVAMAFSNDRTLDPEHVGETPHAPGLVVIIRGGAGRPERVAWVEVTLDIKDWLVGYFSRPEALARQVGLPTGSSLRYRYAEVTDARLREEIAFRVREQAQHMVNQAPSP